MATLTTLAGDWGDPDSRGSLRGSLVLLSSFFMGESFSLAYHEYGHGTRNASVGFRSLYGFGTLRSPEDVEAALSSRPPLSEAERDAMRWDIACRAGGMNNEMFVTEAIEDEVHQSGGHIGFFSLYVKGKLSSSRFSQSSRGVGDINQVIDSYRARGLSIGAADIKRGSAIAFLLSGLSDQVTYQSFASVLGQSSRFQPWTVRGIELPSTSFYMNRWGVSMGERRPTSRPT